MTARPKSAKEIVNEALQAFDLEFNETQALIDNTMGQDSDSDDSLRLREEFRQLHLARKKLGVRLSDKAMADRLTGNMKNLRLKIIRTLE